VGSRIERVGPRFERPWGACTGVCARDRERSHGQGFATARVWEADFSDANGWNSDPKYYSTIQLGRVY
jgi:hypothetical protein